MAINSRNERSCCLAVALPEGRVFPSPDGTIDGADRQQIAFSWRAISAGVIQALVKFYRYYRAKRNG